MKFRSEVFLRRKTISTQWMGEGRGNDASGRRRQWKTTLSQTAKCREERKLVLHTSVRERANNYYLTSIWKS